LIQALAQLGLNAFMKVFTPLKVLFEYFKESFSKASRLGIPPAPSL
jgi:hypothetical protein